MIAAVPRFGGLQGLGVVRGLAGPRVEIFRSAEKLGLWGCGHMGVFENRGP